MSKINITRCVVAWSLKNIRQGLNNNIIIDTTAKTIPDWYYTFSDLKTLLATHKITLEKTLSNHITVVGEKDFKLGKLGSSLLGFDESDKFTKNTKYTSTYSATLTNKIKDIHVYCSLVDSTKNYSYLLSNSSLYYSSSLVLVIPIDTTQQLNGNFSNYNVDSLRLPCRSDYYLQEIEFIVESGGHVEDYEIFLTFELE